ncbi:hypothetical protein B0H14DRAFT_2377316 [Mycena olivaceomarginata]|nr:hypothetical protein B0H14DRAFT_2377316 [Mycena olivaceomarginata]
MARWAKKLSEMTAPCVSVDGDPLFSYVIFSSKRLISLWPSYSQGPALKYFAWSPLITAAVFRNFQLLSQHPPPQALTPTGDRPYTFRSFTPYNSSAPPIPGLLGNPPSSRRFLSNTAIASSERAWNTMRGIN